VSQPDIFQQILAPGNTAVGSPEALLESLKKILNGNTERQPDIPNFARVLQDEYAIAEPIVSCIEKLLYPLANYRNQKLAEVVQTALEQLVLILRKTTALPPQTLAKLDDRLAREALERTQWWFNSEMEALIRMEADGAAAEAQRQRKLCFYFCLRKLVKQFLPDLCVCAVAAPVNQPISRFDRQDLFEILLPTLELIETLPNSVPNLDVKESPKEFFNVPQLYIPLSNELMERYIVPSMPDLKQFLFLPSVVDLSLWCSDIEDQGVLNSCTAFAGIALLEYFMNRSAGKYTDVSPLFLYKATRDLMKLSGDVGASVREMMKAMALFGVPPEQYWPYSEAKVDAEPSQFCYSYAQSYQALKYFRLDYGGISQELLLFQIKAVLAAGLPCVFGFTAYTSIFEPAHASQGVVPFPHYQQDRVVGGHAVMAVGYDDHKVIQRRDRDQPSVGAILIRNSFGAEWGQNGYGWLPYDYVLAGLTADWWSLLKSEWFNNSFWQGRSTGEVLWPPT
jgi:C1A family cysteine protease